MPSRPRLKGDSEGASGVGVQPALRKGGAAGVDVDARAEDFRRDAGPVGVARVAVNQVIDPPCRCGIADCRGDGGGDIINVGPTAPAGLAEALARLQVSEGLEEVVATGPFEVRINSVHTRGAEDYGGSAVGSLGEDVSLKGGLVRGVVGTGERVDPARLGLGLGHIAMHRERAHEDELARRGGAQQLDRGNKIRLQMKIERIGRIPGRAFDAVVNDAAGAVEQAGPARFIGVVTFDEAIDEGRDVIAARVDADQGGDAVAAAERWRAILEPRKPEAPVRAMRIAGSRINSWVWGP
jgi:hypothetical protein